ncbi:hypothetical protein [Endozoicomonas numazuensis]|uniref:Uncharacterized protein n=1 Tax=Endozoicomonas numazuensis TaxID=1137799 RepID=A0A081NGG5_9GAMM|nr:hypothetical protein [Endozoicomonas numazuensis]KEQ17538.1 hypothetical protein GZ78_17490 [Endozoicomonas numazuensis]
MNRNSYKVIIAGIWLLIVFGYLHGLQIVYEAEKSFHLFVVLSIFINLAYDGLKKIISYKPMYTADIRKLFKYSVSIVVSLACSLSSFVAGAFLKIYLDFPEFVAQGVAFTGFIVFIIISMILLNKAEKLFKLSNIA